MSLESRVRTAMVEESRPQVRIQGMWFDYDLIESLLEADGFFSGVRWNEQTWVQEKVPEDLGGYRKHDHPDYKPGYYIIDGQMGELARRGLARESNRGWYGTSTLQLVVDGAGGLP